MQKMPSDLGKVINADAKAAAKWAELTPVSQRDFITWVEGAKQAETRARRISRTREMLLSGKRRPCCYSAVPMDLYSALNENAKAKETWKSLTPDEKRDFSAWIEQGKDKEEKAVRIQLVCGKMMKGERKP